jgi:hypothetical protein
MVEEQAKQITSNNYAQKASLTWNMEAVHFPKVSLNFNQTTGRHVPGESINLPEMYET